MRNINKIIVHCSDSKFGNADRITQWHIERGFSTIGYHYVINNGYVFSKDKYEERTYDGMIETGRSLRTAGAHCKGHNSSSIGICMIGEESFSVKQYTSLISLLDGLMVQYGLSLEDVYGHYEFSDKTCPNFNPREIYKKFKEE